MNARLSRLGRVSPTQILPLVRQVLEGLAAAHAAGIVHRDLKPANIFILREKAGLPDYVKIIDFGISKFQTLAGDARQTRTGTIIGTPSYMAPEQARGLREADVCSDIYAVGVILYEAVTGRLPFEGTSTNDLLFKIYLHEPPAIEALVQDVDPAFATLIMKALSKEPSDRFASATEFIAALDSWTQTGRGVAVAKRVEISATMIERPRDEAKAPTPPPQTQGSWAGSQSGIARLPGKRSAKLTALVFAVAVTALGGGFAVLATRGGGHEKVTAPTSAAPASAPTVAKSSEAVEEPPPVPPATSAANVVPSTPIPSAAPSAASARPAPTSSVSHRHSAGRSSTSPPATANPFEDR
jgi:serine/threonine-protein kinase